MQKSYDELRSSILSSQYFVPGSCREGEDKIKQKQTTYPQIQNGLKIFRLHTKFLMTQLSLSIALISHFVMLIGYFEASQVNGEKENSVTLMRGFISASIFSVIFSIARFKMRNQIAQERRQQKNNLIKMFIQATVLLVQPYPKTTQIYIDIIGISKYSAPDRMHLDSLLLLLGLMKGIFVIRGMLNLIVPYANPRQYRIAKIYGTTNNYIYQVRCLFRQHPVASISILYSFCWLLFAYCFRVCEYEKNSTPSKHSLQNCLWMAMQTMTTVGYGDITPKTLLGGIVSIISSFTGVIGTSLLVLSITTNLQLGYDQERALFILNNMEAKKQMKEKSAVFIRICLWRIWTQFKMRHKIPVSIKQRQLRRQLKQLRINVKNDLKESSRLQESMQEQFYSVGVEVQTLLNNCDQIILFCINKNQIIQGVLKDAQKGKQEKYRTSNYKIDFKHNQYSLVSKKRPNHGQPNDTAFTARFLIKEKSNGPIVDK